MYFVGIDTGRFKVKVWHAGGYFEFFSNLGEARELEFEDVKGKDDIIGSYKGRQFSGGTLARRESEFGSSNMSESKLHEDTVLLNLIALHKAFPNGGIVKMVTGLPLKVHKEEKEGMKKLLKGRHEINVNGVSKTFIIDCEVLPEGAGIYKYATITETVRGLNIGSRTVNAITFRDGVKIGLESDTFDYGTEAGKKSGGKKNWSAMARGIASDTGSLKWKKDDLIYIEGGGSIELYQELKEKYYPNAKLTTNPVFTDAEAFYMAAREIYG